MVIAFSGINPEGVQFTQVVRISVEAGRSGMRIWKPEVTGMRSPRGVLVAIADLPGTWCRFSRNCSLRRIDRTGLPANFDKDKANTVTVESCESSLILDAAPRAIDRLDQRVGIGGAAHTPVTDPAARRVRSSAFSEFKSMTVQVGWSWCYRPLACHLNIAKIQGHWSESASVRGGTVEKYDRIGISPSGGFLFGQDGPYSESGQESS